MSAFSTKTAFSSAIPFLVQPSRVHGSGLFATSFLPATSNVFSFYANVPLATEAPKDVIILSDSTRIDGSISTAKYLNHSCIPNCVAVRIDENTFALKAIKDINKGQELLINYGYGMEGHAERPCNCGEKMCIGFIVAEEAWEKFNAPRKLPASPEPRPAPQTDPVIEKEKAQAVEKRNLRNKRAKARRKARKNRACASKCGQQQQAATNLGLSRGVTTVV